MSRHYVDDSRLLRSVATALRQRFGGPADEEAAREVVEDVRAWLVKQPTEPDLVGATRAAKILGVQTPHITRLREQGRMPEGVPIDGSVEAYLRDEVEELAKELKEERAARRRRRAERSGT